MVCGFRSSGQLYVGPLMRPKNKNHQELEHSALCTLLFNTRRASCQSFCVGLNHDGWKMDYRILTSQNEGLNTEVA